LIRATVTDCDGDIWRCVFHRKLNIGKTLRDPARNPLYRHQSDSEWLELALCFVSGT